MDYKELDNALSELKVNKARDFEGFSNEIFKENIIGTDLKQSLLIMFNKLKKNNKIPSFSTVPM